MSSAMNLSTKNIAEAAIADSETAQTDPSGASATANTHDISNASGQTDDGHNNNADSLPDHEDGVEAGGQSDVGDDFSPLSSCRLTQIDRTPTSVLFSALVKHCVSI